MWISLRKKYATPSTTLNEAFANIAEATFKAVNAIMEALQKWDAEADNEQCGN